VNGIKKAQRERTNKDGRSSERRRDVASWAGNNVKIRDVQVASGNLECGSRCQ
jgi:hypothetical protein